ncbi:DUF6884 domain-containing protein [Salinibacillus xinjiangensis]|uniref:DUF6884 domain-containing protein n=1 Tax=Salinibacillus xinjiangensis TaxID=1229268 RepID=UPI001E2D0FE3|nr:DUF6884 domain-containing protein [Salinibacillus xinjiangensis]
MKTNHTLYIIPSGKPKIWDRNPELGSTKANEAYTGTFHRLCQQYVKQFSDPWVVISPKYGLLRPDDEVKGTYDLSFNIKRNPEVISIETMKQQLDDKGLQHFSNIIMLGGKKFKPIMNQLYSNAQVSFPLHGTKGIGDMQRILKQAIEKGQKISK